MIHLANHLDDELVDQHRRIAHVNHHIGFPQSVEVFLVKQCSPSVGYTSADDAPAAKLLLLFPQLFLGLLKVFESAFRQRFSIPSCHNEPVPPFQQFGGDSVQGLRFLLLRGIDILAVNPE